MPTIRPSSDLRNHYNEISEYCHTRREPVYITKNGVGDLVVLSNEEYESLLGRIDLSRLLAAGLQDLDGKKARSAEDVFTDIERKYSLDEV